MILRMKPTQRNETETIGERLRRLRGERGISQRRLAGPRMWIALGQARWRQGDTPGAEQAFEEAEKIVPPESASLRVLLYNMWSEALESDGRLTEALSMARRATALANA